MDSKLQEEFHRYFHDNRDEIYREFFTFLSFPSISTDSAYQQDVLKCCNYIVTYLKECGLTVETWDTPGHPIIYAETPPKEGLPTLLIYHHYDVQPIDPIDEWNSPPFEPEIRNGNIYARGAQDNKGQCFYSLTALKAFLKSVPEPKFNIKYCIEGEEEIGSPSLDQILPQKKDRLKADHLLIVDGGILGKNEPAIEVGCRGIITFEIECKASSIDLHSGMHGGIALNPNRALIELLAKCWDKDGMVAIPHFYDDLNLPTEKEREELDLDSDPVAASREFGVHAFSPTKGISFLEANWLYPTLEVNGIGGGYIGEGFKTVIPAKSLVKLSCRLVPNQNPDKIGKLVVDFLKKNVASGIELKVELGHGGAAFRTSPSSEIAKIAAQSFSEVFDTPCKKILGGGTIPIIGPLAEASGADPLIIGMGLMGDCIHAPNEHLGMDRFEKGFSVMTRIFEILGNVK